MTRVGLVHGGLVSRYVLIVVAIPMFFYPKMMKPIHQLCVQEKASKEDNEGCNSPPLTRRRRRVLFDASSGIVENLEGNNNLCGFNILRRPYNNNREIAQMRIRHTSILLRRKVHRDSLNPMQWHRWFDSDSGQKIS